ncbi:MAG: hypothetical protein FJ264_18285 [Planctomycetes bacterium]|nr:hypothetical protein [Planctomycetota bacterium]MBM4067281.1 hypothetical protein [Planctomycetota bacterium]
MEEESEADLLNSWGLMATCLDSGIHSAIRAKNIEILSQIQQIIILPVNDKPGRNYASRIANELRGAVDTLEVLELPGLPEKGNILDWTAIPGNDKYKLLDIR